jgi:hypothetical protein
MEIVSSFVPSVYPHICFSQRHFLDLCKLTSIVAVKWRMLSVSGDGVDSVLLIFIRDWATTFPWTCRDSIPPNASCTNECGGCGMEVSISTMTTRTT